MPQVRTTLQPDRVIEVDAAEYADLARQGLLLPDTPPAPPGDQSAPVVPTGDQPPPAQEPQPVPGADVTGAEQQQEA